MDDQEYVPEHVKEMIVAEYIRRLLQDEKRPEDDEYTAPINPYSLDSKQPLRFESRFIHGVKEPAPAYKETKSAAKSVIECEFMREVNGQLDLSGVYGTTELVAVNILGDKGTYYVPASSLKRILQDNITKAKPKPCEGGTAVFAQIEVDRQALMDHILGKAE